MEVSALQTGPPTEYIKTNLHTGFTSQFTYYNSMGLHAERFAYFTFCAYICQFRNCASDAVSGKLVGSGGSAEPCCGALE